MSGQCSNRAGDKTSWPELKGINGQVAVQIIENENRNVNAIVFPENNAGTTDFNPCRVRVKVDSNGIVTSTPKVG